MMPIRKNQNWLPSIFNDFFDDDNCLVVSMEKKNENKDEKHNGRYLRREFSYSKFQQTMILPDDVDKEKISAKVEHGVLTVDVPKKAPVETAKLQRNIEIK